MGLGSGIREKLIPDPGVKKASYPQQCIIATGVSEENMIQ